MGTNHETLLCRVEAEDFNEIWLDGLPLEPDTDDNIPLGHAPTERRMFAAGFGYVRLIRVYLHVRHPH